jgi:ankyrin repeat protein
MKSVKLTLSIFLLSTSCAHGMIVPKLTELCGQFLGEQIINDSTLDCNKIVGALLTYKDAGFEDSIYLKIIFGVLGSQKLSKTHRLSIILNVLNFLKTDKSNQSNKRIKQLIKKIVTVIYQIPDLCNQTDSPLQVLLRLDKKYNWLLSYFALQDSFIIDALCEYILKNNIKSLSELLPNCKDDIMVFLCLNPEIMIKLKNNSRYVPSQETLLKACKEKKTEIFKLMISIGANINGKINDNDWTLLICAAWENDREGVRLLLESGVNINLSSKNGCTALIAASQKGYLEIVKLLLEHNANVNFANNHGMTALHIASINHHTQVVQLLLKFGANINAKDKDGLTPFNSMGHEDIRQIFIKQNINLQDKKGWTQLIHAVWNQDINRVEDLLSKKAAVNIKIDNGATALTAAVVKRNEDIVKLLLQNGAEVNLTTTNSGTTPLMIAAENGHLEVIILLLASGADKNVVDHQGKNALAMALENDHANIVDLLLEN